MDIYTLCENGSVIPRYLSEDTYMEKLALNLDDTHFSYVCNIKAYLQKYRCASYGPHFTYLSHWQHHQGNYAKATEYKFSGRYHKMPSSIFNHLEEFNITFPVEDRLYPWFMVYDFEAILSHVPENQPTPWLKWLRRHDPISVSVASNVPGLTSAQGFVHQEPTALIQDMMKYLGNIADSVYEAAQQKWAPVITKLEHLIQCSEQQPEKLKDK